MSDTIKVKIGIHDERLDNLEEEQMRTRDRLHVLEQDRIALKLISQRVDDMASAAKTTAAQIVEVSSDVKTLLLAHAHNDGASDERKSWLSSRRFVVTSLLTLGTLVVGLVSALATIVWLQHT